MQTKLLEKDRKKIEKGSTSNVQAHTLYLKGRFDLNRWDEVSLLSAVNYFKQAIEIDPNYALAFCGLAFATNWLGFQELINSKDWASQLQEYGRKALELDETLAEAHVVQGFVLFRRHENAGAEREFRRAIELNPNVNGAHLLLANIFSWEGRRDDCLTEIEKELELDPLSAGTAGDVGTLYLYLREYDKAIQQLESALEIDPGSNFNRNNLGLAYIQKGMLQKGLEEMEQAQKLVSPRDLAYAYVKAGKLDEAKKLLADLLSSDEKQIATSMDLAGVYANLGEKAKAIQCLEKAYDDDSPYLRMISTDFVFDTLRDEPGFKAILKKIGLA